MRSCLGNDANSPERKALGIFPLLRNHHRIASFQTGDLPVDMQHLRFEKCRAITSDNRARLGRWKLQRPTLNAQRSMFNSRGVPFQPDRLLKTLASPITIVVSAVLSEKTFGIAAPEDGCAEDSARYSTISPAVSET